MSGSDEAFGNDGLHLLPDKLVAAVPELVLRLEVHEDDLPALIHQHHRVRSRLQETAVAGFQLRQMSRGLPAHADVADRRRHHDSIGAVHGAQHDLDRELASIFPSPGQLDPGTDLLRQRLRRSPRAIRDQPLGETLWNDVLDQLSEELVAAIPELSFGLRVDQQDTFCAIDDHDRIGSGLEERAVLRFGGTHFVQLLDRRRRKLGGMQARARDRERRMACQDRCDVEIALVVAGTVRVVLRQDEQPERSTVRGERHDQQAVNAGPLDEVEVALAGPRRAWAIAIEHGREERRAGVEHAVSRRVEIQIERPAQRLGCLAQDVGIRIEPRGEHQLRAILRSQQDGAVAVE